jgi:hypothetical protein
LHLGVAHLAIFSVHEGSHSGVVRAASVLYELPFEGVVGVLALMFEVEGVKLFLGVDCHSVDG